MSQSILLCYNIRGLSGVDARHLASTLVDLCDKHSIVAELTDKREFVARVNVGVDISDVPFSSKECMIYSKCETFILLNEPKVFNAVERFQQIDEIASTTVGMVEKENLSFQDEKHAFCFISEI